MATNTDVPIFDVDLSQAPKKGEFKPRKWPVDKLAVGKGFLITQLNGKPKYSSVRLYTFEWSKSYGGKFRCQDQNNGTILVWRES